MAPISKPLLTRRSPTANLLPAPTSAACYSLLAPLLSFPPATSPLLSLLPEATLLPHGRQAARSSSKVIPVIPPPPSCSPAPSTAPLKKHDSRTAGSRSYRA